MKLESLRLTEDGAIRMLLLYNERTLELVIRPDATFKWFARDGKILAGSEGLPWSEIPSLMNRVLWDLVPLKKLDR